jgi:hypothetical protein
VLHQIRVYASPIPKFSQRAFVWATRKRYVNFSDFADPVKGARMMKNDIQHPGEDGIRSVSIREKTTVSDVPNLLIGKKKQTTFLDFVSESQSIFNRKGKMNCSFADFASGTCEPYFAINYRSSGVAEEITRTYKDILGAFSEIGGYKEVVFLMFGLVYAFYNGHHKQKYMIHQLVPEKDIDLYHRFALGRGVGQSVGGQSSILTSRPESVPQPPVQSSRPHQETSLSKIHPAGRGDKVARVDDGVGELLAGMLNGGGTGGAQEEEKSGKLGSGPSPPLQAQQEANLL